MLEQTVEAREPRKSPGNKALQNRLEADTLSVSDKEKLELTRQIRALRKKGLTLRQCSVAAGVGQRKVEQFANRGIYKLFCEYLDRLERGTDEEVVEKVVRKAKHEFAGFAPDTIDYYRTCFLRNPLTDREEKGEFRDDAKAMWAADKVSKGLGLTEPEHAIRPIINISIAHIKFEQEMVNADDAEAAAAARAIDVTPTPA